MGRQPANVEPPAMRHLRILVGAYVVAALVSACGGGSSHSLIASVDGSADGCASPHRAVGIKTSGRYGPNLYVANNYGDNVTVYARGGTRAFGNDLRGRARSECIGI